MNSPHTDRTVSYTHLMEDVDLATADALKRAAASMGIGAQLLALESHRLSYEYYALSQRRELWTHDVGLFEYDRRGLRYHHLSVSWKHHPPVVTAETTVLNQYLDGHELADPVPPEKMCIRDRFRYRADICTDRWL